MVHLKIGLLSDGIHSFIIIFSQKCIKYRRYQPLPLCFLACSKIQCFCFLRSVRGKAAILFTFTFHLLFLMGLYDCYFRKRIVAFIWPSPSLTFIWNDISLRRCAFFSSLNCRLAGADPACGCTSSACN